MTVSVIGCRPVAVESALPASKVFLPPITAAGLALPEALLENLFIVLLAFATLGTGFRWAIAGTTPPASRTRAVGEAALALAA